MQDKQLNKIQVQVIIPAVSSAEIQVFLQSAVLVQAAMSLTNTLYLNHQLITALLGRTK